MAYVHRHDSVVKLLLSSGATIPSDLPLHAAAVGCQEIIDDWPVDMAIIVFKELCLYGCLDASSLIDLRQYIGSLTINNLRRSSYRYANSIINIEY